MKKFISIVVAAVMLATMIAATAMADEVEYVRPGDNGFIDVPYTTGQNLKLDGILDKGEWSETNKIALNETNLVGWAGNNFTGPIDYYYSWGDKGLVTDALRALLEAGEQYDEVITIGPLIMMKFVCKLTKEFGVKTVASMNPIMIDGTGMCGCCRLTVGGKVRFACVDGPDFDGHQIDFDEAMARGTSYRDFEKKAREDTCNLFREVR